MDATWIPSILAWSTRPSGSWSPPPIPLRLRRTGKRGRNEMGMGGMREGECESSKILSVENESHDQSVAESTMPKGTEPAETTEGG